MTRIRFFSDTNLSHFLNVLEYLGTLHTSPRTDRVVVLDFPPSEYVLENAIELGGEVLR